MKLPQKRSQGGRHLHCQLPQSVFEDDEAEETTEKIKKKNKKKNKKKLDKLFLFNFSNLPPKRCPGGRRLHSQRHQSVFEEDEAEEVA